MIHFKKILFAFILPGMSLLFVTGKAFSQDVNSFPRHLIEIYIPTYHFFDGTPVVFGPTIPDEKIPGRRGISYTFLTKKRTGIQVSNDAYLIFYPEANLFSYKPGDVIIKNTVLYSAYFLYPTGNKIINCMVKGGFRYRRGYERSFEYYHSGRPRGYGNKLRDVGPSIGLQLNKPLWKKLTLGISGTYTYFLYLHDKGLHEQYAYWYFDRGASRHLMDVTLRLGYRF